MRELAVDRDPAARSVAAYVLGQLGVPARTQPGESARALEAMAAEEHHPEVLAAIAGAFGNLGEPHGTEWLLRLHRHPDAPSATPSPTRWPAARTRAPSRP